MATSMLKVASDIYKMPLYRNAHSPENSSDEWAFFFPCIKFTFVGHSNRHQVMDLKIIIFYLSQSIGARFQGLQWVL